MPTYIGRIPSEWKKHKISPIPKNRDLFDISKLQTNIPTVYSIQGSRVYHFKQNYCLCSPKNIQTAVWLHKKQIMLFSTIIIFAIVYEALDKRSKVDMIYLDVCKAFDSVPHKELLYKLWRIGITGDLWLWLKNYLSDRSHYVSFNNVASSTDAVLSGVPQGSILGTLLFIIYVNDIPDT